MSELYDEAKRYAERMTLTILQGRGVFTLDTSPAGVTKTMTQQQITDALLFAFMEGHVEGTRKATRQTLAAVAAHGVYIPQDRLRPAL